MQNDLLPYGIYELLWPKQPQALRGTALRYFGRTVSYRGMFAQAERCARALLRWEVKAGDPVLLCSTATPELVYALLALWKIGAVPCLINPQSPDEEMRAFIRRSKAGLCLVLDQLIPYVKEALEEVPGLQLVLVPAVQSMPLLKRGAIAKSLPVSTLAGLSVGRQILWKEFLESGQSVPQAPASPVSEGGEALLLQGRGTNGAGKSLDHEAVIRRAVQMGETAPWNREEAFLGLLPPWQEKGLTETVVAPLSAGLSLELEPRLHPKAFVQLLSRETIAHAAAPVRYWLHAAERVRAGALALGPLKTAYLFSGWDDVPQEEGAQIESLLGGQESLRILYQ